VNKPKIDVVIPVYNGEKYLRETLESLASQRYSQLKIIVVDDGSTDGTASIVKHHSGSIIYIKQDNSGSASAFNRAIQEADADFVAAIDADDLWSPTKLQLQLPPLLADHSLGMSLGKIQRFWIGNTGQKKYLPPESAMSFLCGLFRREVFDTVGLLDTSLDTHNDLDWFMRARESGVPIYLHDDTVGYYRRHGENQSTTTDLEKADAARLEMLRRSLSRRRGTKGISSDNPLTHLHPTRDDPA
jgi:glycosyltransferase involved in cell wall biosynthesis